MFLRSTCPNHLNLPHITTFATLWTPKRLYKTSLRFLSFRDTSHVYTSISPSCALFSPGYADSQPSLPMSKSHMSTHWTQALKIFPFMRWDAPRVVRMGDSSLNLAQAHRTLIWTYLLVFSYFLYQAAMTHIQSFNTNYNTTLRVKLSYKIRYIFKRIFMACLGVCLFTKVWLNVIKILCLNIVRQCERVDNKEKLARIKVLNRSQYVMEYYKLCYFLADCLKSGTPTTMCGDIFFEFVCVGCSETGQEKFERMVGFNKQFPW